MQALNRGHMWCFAELCAQGDYPALQGRGGLDTAVRDLLNSEPPFDAESKRFALQTLARANRLSVEELADSYGSARGAEASADASPCDDVDWGEVSSVPLEKGCCAECRAVFVDPETRHLGFDWLAPAAITRSLRRGHEHFGCVVTLARRVGPRCRNDCEWQTVLQEARGPVARLPRGQQGELLGVLSSSLGYACPHGLACRAGPPGHADRAHWVDLARRSVCPRGTACPADVAVRAGEQAAADGRAEVLKAAGRQRTPQQKGRLRY